MNEAPRRLPMKMRDMCNKNVPEKSYQQHSKSEKLFYNTSQLGKIHCTPCNPTLFPKAYEQHLQTEKRFVKLEPKIKCDKCQIIYD